MKLPNQERLWSDHDHESDAARRILDLLSLIRVTEKLGEETLSADFLVGYNHVLECQ